MSMMNRRVVAQWLFIASPSLQLSGCGADSLFSEGHDEPSIARPEYSKQPLPERPDAVPDDGPLDIAANRAKKIVHSEPIDQTAASCPGGTIAVVKDDSNNNVLGQPGECVVTLGGKDKITGQPAAVLAGSGNDNANLTNTRLVATGPGSDHCNLSGSDIEVYLQEDADTCNITGANDGVIDAGPGADTLNVTGTAVRVWLRAGDDKATVNGADAHIDGGFGDDLIHVSGAGSVVHPGPGKDNVHVSGTGAVAQIFSLCEVVPGEKLHASGTNTTLIIPVDLPTLSGMGVLVAGFSQVEVDPGVAHESDCHCFHGQVATLTDDGVTCDCDAGWGGPRCDECVDLEQCISKDRVTAAVQTLLAAAPPGTADNPGAVQRTFEFVVPMMLSDTTVVAGVRSVTEFRRATLTPKFFETFTEAELSVVEVLRGAEVSTVRIVFSGPASHEDPAFGSESPFLAGGNRRVYGIALHPDESSLVDGAADWRVTVDDEIDLGFYKVHLDTLRQAVIVAP